MIPEGFITGLLERADIVDVINRYVPLKKAGRNWMCCCPFHKEKTPSFSVSQTKQFFKCFGCGEAGNAIGFIMKYEGLAQGKRRWNCPPKRRWGGVLIIEPCKHLWGLPWGRPIKEGRPRETLERHSCVMNVRLLRRPHRPSKRSFDLSSELRLDDVTFCPVSAQNYSSLGLTIAVAFHRKPCRSHRLRQRQTSR